MPELAKACRRDMTFCQGATKGLFIWKPGWPAKRDSPVSEISLCSYFYSKNYRAFIWTSGLARLPRSRLKEARSRLPGWEFRHINTHKRAGPVAGMKVQRYRRKLFLTTVKSMSKQEIVPASGMKFSHINTREIHPLMRESNRNLDIPPPGIPGEFACLVFEEGGNLTFFSSGRWGIC